MGVDDLVAVVLDEVRLEDDALALEGNTLAEVFVLASHHVGEVGVVIAGRRDVDARFAGRAAAGTSRPGPARPSMLERMRSPSDGGARRRDRRRHGAAASALLGRPGGRDCPRPAFRASAVSACRSGAGRTHGVAARAAWAARMRGVQPGQALGDAGLVRISVEGQPRPAQVFQVVALLRLPPQELHGRRRRAGRPAGLAGPAASAAVGPGMGSSEMPKMRRLP